MHLHGRRKEQITFGGVFLGPVRLVIVILYLLDSQAYFGF